ncbi:MAG TPA: segregation/condensation protein A [Anaerolineae bacterium]|nr:segregation/condensation protein A [Anaerolineae bacterium]
MQAFTDASPQPDTYLVRLPLFEGPLDLLLHLIQKNELDITAISLALVADQFIEHLQTIGQVQADIIADFLVVAAKLLLIKSRLLLPKPPNADDEEEDDPAELLARRLREYKRFKQAAGFLKQQEDQGRHCYVRVAPPPPMETRIDWEAISLDDLLLALQRLLEREEELQPVGALVAARKVTVREKIEWIEQLIRAGRPVSFQRVVGKTAGRIDIVVSLWAVLEMIKRGQLRAYQSELFGEIYLEPALAASANF